MDIWEKLTSLSNLANILEFLIALLTMPRATHDLFFFFLPWHQPATSLNSLSALEHTDTHISKSWDWII